MDTSLKDYIHVRTKSSYAGAKELVPRSNFLLKSGIICYEEFIHSPCYFHCINEILVNAFDQVIKSQNYEPEFKVNTINVVSDNGTISVHNNGQGMGVYKRKHNGKKEYWNPYIILTKLRSGSNNMVTDKVVGGDNGYGCKIVVYCSNRFKVTTFDKERNQYYEQTFTCKLKNVTDELVEEEPIFDGEFEGTKIEFSLDPTFLGYTPDKYGKFKIRNLNKYIKAHLILLMVHVKSLGFNVNISFNGTQLTYDFKYDIVSNAGLNHPFKVYIGTSMGISMVNNLVSTLNKSTHITYVKRYIRDSLKDRLVAFCSENKLKGFNITKIFSNITFSISAQIPDISPDSQKKTLIEFKTDKLDGFKLSKELLEHVYDIVTVALLGKRRIRIAKPIFTQPSSRSKCTLLITEGKHASDMIDLLLNHMDRRQFGVFDVQGVTTNVYRKTKMVNGLPVFSGKKLSAVDSKGCMTNRLLQIAQILGLSFGELPNMKKYKRVVICSDEDEDGVGNIASLIIVFFWHFWPSMFNLGQINRWQTPVIRLKRNKLKSTSLNITTYNNEFKSEVLFEKWVNSLGTNFDDSMLLVSKYYEVIYLKGLGSHNVNTLKVLADTFEDNILTFSTGKHEAKFVECMFGHNANNRKNELSLCRERKELRVRLKDGLRWVTFADHIKNETRSFHLLRIWRALPCYIDGLTISQRKIVFYSLFNLKKTGVANLAGDIKSKMQYHHGEVSLEGTIIKMAQTFKGANCLLPIFEGEGIFGTIKNGTKSKVQPRYVKVLLKSYANILFPSEDRYLYEYVYDDGYKVEPKFMIPIIPFALLLNRHTPGSGWKVQCWARDIGDLIDKVIDKLNDIKVTHLKCSVDVTYDDEGFEIDIGRSEIINGKTIIYELPLSIFVNPFLESLDCKYQDRSDDKSLRLEVNKEITPSKKLITNLNFLGEKKKVVHFESYVDILDSWFELRFELYVKRIERQIEILEIEILVEENIVTLIKSWESMGIDKDTTNKEWKKKLKVFDKVIKKFDIVEVKKYCLENGNHKYLTSLNIKTFGSVGLNRHQTKLVHLRDKLNLLKMKEISDIWKEELESLRKLI
jgi:DNA topoisomerase-2